MGSNPVCSENEKVPHGVPERRIPVEWKAASAKQLPAQCDLVRLGPELLPLLLHVLVIDGLRNRYATTAQLLDLGLGKSLREKRRREEGRFAVSGREPAGSRLW